MRNYLTTSFFYFTTLLRSAFKKGTWYLLVLSSVGCWEVSPESLTLISGSKGPISLSGYPFPYSNSMDTSVSINVSFDGDFTGYTFAFGSSLATCTSSLNIAAELPVTGTDTISAGILAYPDGDLFVCVIGKSSDGTWQNISDAVFANWIKDSTPPALPVNLTRVNPAAAISNSSVLIVDVDFTPSSIAYDDWVYLYADSLCTINIGFDISLSTYSTFSLATAPFSEGIHTIFARTLDSANNWSACSAASVDYEYDNTPPSTPSSLTLASPASSPNYISTPTLNVFGNYSPTDNVNLYTNASCTSVVVGTNSGSGSTATLVTLSSAMTSGNSISLYAKVYDNAGNGSAGCVGPVNYTYDGIAPTITAINSPSADATYINGQTITINLQFSEPVNFNPSAGAATLDLETGANDGQASSMTAAGPVTSLSLQYNVLADHFSNDLDVNGAAAFSLTGGASIQDAAGNPLDQNLGSLSLASIKNIRIVGTPAMLTISDPNIPPFDFGVVSIGSPITRIINVTNIATAVVDADIDNVIFPNTAFDFAGGVYPGTSGNCPTLIPPGTNCQLDVEFNPLMAAGYDGDFTISYNNGTGLTTAQEVFMGSGSAGPPPLVVMPFYSIAQDWNSYVQNDGVDIFAASNTACNGNLVNYFSACLHGAEMKRVAVPASVSPNSCANLTMQDLPNNMFNWECDDNGGLGPVEFRTKELKDNFGLRNMIVGGASPVWRSDLSVELRQTGTPVRWSNPMAWWGNPIVIQNSSGSFVNLNTAGQIRYVHSNVTIPGFNISENAISLVTAAGAKISFPDVTPAFNCNNSTGGTASPNVNAHVCTGGRRFLWIEAEFDSAMPGANSAHNGLVLVNTNYSRVVNSKIENLQGGGNFFAAYISNSVGNLFKNVNIYNVANGPYFSGASSNNVLLGVNVAKATYTASTVALMRVEGASNNNIFANMRLAGQVNFNCASTGNGSGIFVASSGNVFSSVHISNIRGCSGIRLQSTANNNRFSQLYINGVNDAGIRLMSGAVGNVFNHMTLTNNIWNGVYFEGSVANSNNYFNSLAIVNSEVPLADSTTGLSSTANNKFNNISVASATGWLINLTGTGYIIDGYIQKDSAVLCGAGAGLNSACARSGGAIPAITNASIASSFVGKFISTDVETDNDLDNSSFSFPVANINSLTRWLGFSFFERTIGIENGGANPVVAGQRGPCITGNCSFWDWRLLNSGTALLNKSLDGNTANPPFTTGVNNCNSVLSPVITASGNDFIMNATEILGRGGDNDSLCEANEDCVYAPNIGAFQGQGDVNISTFCTTSGLVPGARIYPRPAFGI